MSLRGKRDIQATKARGFISKRSFIRLGDGAEILSGKDWHSRVMDVFIRDEHACRGCGKDMDWGYEWMDVHHIVKRGDGGSDNLENLILLCRDCHNKQHPEKQVQWSARP